MTSKQRAYLKSLAMNIDSLFQIGKSGVTPEVVQAVEEAFNNRELIKLSVLKNCFDNPKELAETIAGRTKSTVVQVIGKKIVLYKPDPKTPKIHLPKAYKVDRMKQRIGILGGTFNPIHYGHLILGENALTQFHLDTVIFMPTGHTPHKNYTGTVLQQHRIEMVKLAICSNPYFKLSEYETSRKEVSYTASTIHYFQIQYPEAELFFILGADSLFDFENWKDPEYISANSTILVAVRDTLNEEKVDRQIDYLETKYRSTIFRLSTPNFYVSSKEIRDRVISRDSIRYLLPDSVRTYILEHKLYEL